MIVASLKEMLSNIVRFPFVDRAVLISGLPSTGIFSKKVYWVIIYAHSPRTKLTCTKGMHEMNGGRTTVISDIHVRTLKNCACFT